MSKEDMHLGPWQRLIAFISFAWAMFIDALDAAGWYRKRG